jgi:ribonuclease HI
MGLGVELIKKEGRDGQVTIAADSKAAIQGTQSARAGSGAYLVDWLHRAVQRLQRAQPGLHLTIRWVPGHTGIAGNEAVDREAKKAAGRDESTQRELPGWARRKFPTNKSAALQAFNADLKDRT